LAFSLHATDADGRLLDALAEPVDTPAPVSLALLAARRRRR